MEVLTGIVLGVRSECVDRSFRHIVTIHFMTIHVHDNSVSVGCTHLESSNVVCSREGLLQITTCSR